MKQKQGFTSTVVKNVFYQGLSGVISKVGGLIFTIIVARLLFPELFGIYSLTLTIILTLVTFTDIGLSSTILRYIAESLGRRKSREARSRFLFLLKFKFVSALLLSIILFLLAWPIAGLFNKPALILPLQIGALYLFIISIYTAFSTLFYAMQNFKYNTIAETIFQFSRIVLVILSLYFYKTVFSVFIALSISLFFAFLFLFILTFKKYGFLIMGRREPVERRRMILFSAFLFLSSFSAVIFTNIDKLMLGYFVPAEFVGYYTAIFSIVSGFLGFLALSVVVFPVFTQIHGKRLERAFKKTFRYLAMVAFPVTIGLAYIFIPLFQILYGQAYAPVEHTLTLTLTSVFLSLLVFEGIITSLYVTLFNAKENPKTPAVIMMISALINIILNFLLISYMIRMGPGYGLIGAALATFLSRYIYFTVLAVSSNRKLKISPDKSSIIKPLTASMIMLAFMLLFRYFVPTNVLYGIIMIIAAALVYISVLFLIKGITKEDTKLFRLLYKR